MPFLPVNPARAKLSPISRSYREVEAMQARTAALAILGGAPRFERPRHVGTPNIGDRASLMARIGDALDRRWLTNQGCLVQEFEARIRDHIGARHVIVVTNATVGLELAIRAMNLTGEVIVPSFTFVATAHALHWLGIRPVFCDVDPVTHMLDPAKVEALITPRTTAILGVHLWGRPCAPDALAAIAHRHGLRLIFDAAHAFGCSHGATMIGNLGDAEVFSFHATKALNSLEGGAIATNDDTLALRLRRMINFGFSGLDTVECCGTNGKMNEFSAAMGLTSLDAMDVIIAANRSNHALYRAGLANIPGISLLEYATQHKSNFHYIVVEVNPARFGLTRDEIVGALRAENVQARRYFHPGCHGMEPYRTLEPDLAARLPATVALCQRVLLLPNGIAMSAADIGVCCRLIADIQRRRVAVRVALQPQLERAAADTARAQRVGNLADATV